MIQRPDSDTISIHIPIRGKAALIRNTLIGAVLGAAVIAAMASFPYSAQVLIQTLLWGGAVGGFTALTAWLGQRLSGSIERRARINGTAVWNSGLIGAAIGIVGVAVMMLVNYGTFYSEGQALLVSAFNVVVGLVFGGMIGAAITSAIAIFMLIQARITPSSAHAHHLLGQHQFDPLQHIEEVPDHARR